MKNKVLKIIIKIILAVVSFPAIVFSALCFIWVMSSGLFGLIATPVILALLLVPQILFFKRFGRKHSVNEIVRYIWVLLMTVLSLLAAALLAEFAAGVLGVEMVIM